MHNSAEKRFLITITTIIVSLVAIALLVFLVNYTKSSLYPTTAKDYVKVEYINEQTSTELIAVNEKLPLPELERTGYTFRGWYYDENGLLKAQASEIAVSDTKLYAFWDINRYTVSINPNFDNQAVSYQVLKYNESFVIYPPVRIGYSFESWYSDPECTSLVSLTTMPAENITVYAKWTINKYTLKLFPGEGIDAIDDQIIQYNDTLDLPVLEKEGYTFLGWYKERALVNQVVTGTQMPANNLNLYAGWIANNYNISFVTNGGSAITAIPAAYKQNITATDLPETSRAGYDFVYWYTDIDDDSTEFITGIMPLGGITLYAKWQARNDTQYKIEYYFEDGEGNFVLNTDETETLQGTTEDYRSITYKTFTGYTYDSGNILNYTEGYIYGDGSTVFRFYYKLA